MVKVMKHISPDGKLKDKENEASLAFIQNSSK